MASVLVPGVRRVQRQIGPYAAWWEDHNHAALRADGPLWVVLGDSMSQGIGASAPDRGWVGQLMEDEFDYRVVNLSVSGGMIADVTDRQIPTLRSLGVEPDLVTVMVGSNDLFNRRARAHLVDRATTMFPLLPDGAVVATLPQPRADAHEFNRRLIDSPHLEVAEYRDPRLRDWAGRLAEDRFHPNDAGYAAMAMIMREAIDRR